MLRHSCRSLCCSRPVAFGRSLSLATASSSTSSSAQASSSSSSSHRVAHSAQLPTGPLIIDPSILTDKSHRSCWPDRPAPLPRLADEQHAALHHRQPPSTSTSVLPPKPVLSPENSHAHQLELDREATIKAQAAGEVPLQPVLNAPGPGLDTSDPELEDEQLTVLAKIRDGQSCFFTGAAGTGKSVLLRTIVRMLERDNKKVAVTATTGIAARNLGTQARTIHAWGQIGYGRMANNNAQRILASTSEDFAAARQRWLETEVLIIDEISMLDGRVLDDLDLMGRVIRSRSAPENGKKPFGGIQVVFAGDFYQLPPVPDFSAVALFAFESKAWRSVIKSSGPDMNCFFLRKVHRQGNPRFRELLNRLRVGQSTPDDIKLLKQCHRPIKYEDGIEPVRLYALRKSVTQENEAFLDSLPGELFELPSIDNLSQKTLATVRSGRRTWTHVDRLRQYADRNSRAPAMLRLKAGATVMMLQNNLMGKDYIVNGMQGIVIGYDEGNETKKVPATVRVRFASGLEKDIPRLKEQILMESDAAMSMSRLQFPLKLAHAITIHKSQGQTLDRVVVNTRHCWEEGQIYVALSRATSLDGLQVKFINPKNPAMKANRRVLDFMAGFAADDVQALTT